MKRSTRHWYGYAIVNGNAYIVRAARKYLPFAPPLTFETITIDKWGKPIKRETKNAYSYIEDLDGIHLEMVAIPKGKFMMGSRDEERGKATERPQHRVTIRSFFMGKYPITQEQWRVIASRADLTVERELNPNPSHFKGDNKPVENVSWDDAIEFCARLSKLTGREYRLPSEAEWEYACRAGTTTPFHFGETITGELANYDAHTFSFAMEPPGKYREKTTRVGKFPPNAFGLYDMHGNVAEWCSDNWHENYQNAPGDGSAWLEDHNDLRVLRGGTWNGWTDHCRSAHRLRDRPDFAYRDTGFRVACFR